MGLMRKTLTVRLIPSARTDVPCLACGGFRTDAVIVLPGIPEEDAQTGIHRQCIAPKARKEKRS